MTSLLELEKTVLFVYKHTIIDGDGVAQVYGWSGENPEDFSRTVKVASREHFQTLYTLYSQNSECTLRPGIPPLRIPGTYRAIITTDHGNNTHEPSEQMYTRRVVTDQDVLDALTKAPWDRMQLCTITTRTTTHIIKPYSPAEN